MLIVGTGSLKKVLLDDIKHNHLSDLVIMKGFLTHASVIRLMRRATMLVVPSTNEFFPNVLIEAIFSGLPVIATNLGGIPYIIENMRTGILVPPHDACALSHAVETLLQDPRLRQRIASAARKSIGKRFSPERARLAAQEMLKYVFKPERSNARHASKT